ncbi:class I SAM-dependent methyltransferase [Streptomyces sp. NPDC048411]|uniref:class I SAM-dependent methyltransferase n=1 Tax=Streptomyces sp. NPDC048411 TaxID=3157206 RepID=UPI003455A2AB
MFTPQGPTLRELAVQALSSTERGYDLLAEKFDRTPFRTPDHVLKAVEHALTRLGPFDRGLDLCCGTGAGMDVLRRLCRERVTGVDFSAGMLAVGRSAHPPTPSGGPALDWVRADALALPFQPAFDLAVSFGAFGHFLPEARPGLFAQVHAALRPGGRFAFPVGALPRVGSPLYWALLGFDTTMRVRNALWRPRFVMYYRTFRLPDVLEDLAETGFEVELLPLEELGRRPDGSPRCRLVVARRGASLGGQARSSTRSSSAASSCSATPSASMAGARAASH